MSIPCPYCRAVLNPTGLKPGRFQPKCPNCARPFVILLSVQPLEVANPKSAPEPDADPNATGDFSEPKPAAPLPKTLVRQPAPAVEHADPYATGDFSEPEAPKPKKAALPKTELREPEPETEEDAANATGDFTSLEGDKPAARKLDPNVTGDFTAPGDDAVPQNPGEVTGEFTASDEPKAAPPSKKAAKRDPAATRSPGQQEEETEDADLAPPRLGGYEVLKVLGRGGMGAVLLGRQVSLDRKVAIKVMHAKIATNPSFVARFTREAYAAAQLTHHNVVQIYDIGEDAGQHFFSMEFVQGQSLMDVVKKEGKLPADVAVGYILQAARGLRYGHRQGMVHRDIKPDNLMLNTDGIVKVADLGLVKLPGGSEARSAERGVRNEKAEDADDGSSSTPSSALRAPHLTNVGAVMGTPAYMSPEQSTDSASVDDRADVYSLGCTLYVMITGKPPFEGKTALEIISKHQTQPITPPEVVVKRVPKALSAILLKMMAKKPQDRHQSMDEVITALEGFLGLERAGPFNPKEEQADQLEKCAHQYQHRSKSV